MTTVDIFIKTYHNDFYWLEFCLRSIHKYATGFRNIVIVSDNDGHVLPPHFADIVPIQVYYVDVPKKNPPKLKQPIGYLWQQVLKLLWMEYTDADAVLVLDSDEMLSCPLTPADLRDEKGRWRWIYRSWEQAGSGFPNAKMWHKPTADALLFDPPYEAMCVAGFVLERHTTHRFTEYLKRMHDAENLWHVFFKYPIELFSEYNAYGSFVNRFDNDDIYYKVVNSHERFINHTIIKSWSYGGLDAADKQRRDDILSSD